MAWLRNIQQGYRVASSAQHYLEALAQERAEFRRELADLDPAGREAALAAVRWRKVIKWSFGGGALSLASFAASPEAGLCLSAIIGTRVALLIRKPIQERCKRELIEAFVPLLNEYRELLLRYPVDTLSEDVRDGVARRIARLAELMHRLGVPHTGESPEQVVAGYVFQPDGFYGWKPRRVRTMFTQELPRDILMEPHFVGLGFTPERFRTYLDDVTQTLDDAYREAFEKQGNLVYGYVEPIAGVCELPAGMPVGLPLFHEHRFNHTVWFGKTGSGKSTHLLDLIIQDIAAGMGVICSALPSPSCCPPPHGLSGRSSTITAGLCVSTYRTCEAWPSRQWDSSRSASSSRVFSRATTGPTCRDFSPISCTPMNSRASPRILRTRSWSCSSASASSG